MSSQFLYGDPFLTNPKGRMLQTWPGGGDVFLTVAPDKKSFCNISRWRGGEDSESGSLQTINVQSCYDQNGSFLRQNAIVGNILIGSGTPALVGIDCQGQASGCLMSASDGQIKIPVQLRAPSNLFLNAVTKTDSEHFVLLEMDGLSLYSTNGELKSSNKQVAPEVTSIENLGRNILAGLTEDRKKIVLFRLPDLAKIGELNTPSDHSVHDLYQFYGPLVTLFADGGLGVVSAPDNDTDEFLNYRVFLIYTQDGIIRTKTPFAYGKNPGTNKTYGHGVDDVLDDFQVRKHSEYVSQKMFIKENILSQAAAADANVIFTRVPDNKHLVGIGSDGRVLLVEGVGDGYTSFNTNAVFMFQDATNQSRRFAFSSYQWLNNATSPVKILLYDIAP